MIIEFRTFYVLLVRFANICKIWHCVPLDQWMTQQKFLLPPLPCKWKVFHHPHTVGHGGCAYASVRHFPITRLSHEKKKNRCFSAYIVRNDDLKVFNYILWKLSKQNYVVRQRYNIIKRQLGVHKNSWVAEKKGHRGLYATHISLLGNTSLGDWSWCTKIYISMNKN